MPKCPVKPQTERLILGIAGRMGSGKTTAAEYLVKAHGFKYLRYSQVLADWQAANPVDKAQLQQIGWEVMGGGMQRDLNARLIARVGPGYSYAIDGLRHPIDSDILGLHFPREFHLIFVSCPTEIRWQRLRQRFQTFQHFQKADEHPVEQQLTALENSAEFHIDDSGDESVLFAELESILYELERGARQ